MTLRLITYLAPSIPLRLYEALAAYLSGRLRQPVSLISEQRHSGPSWQDDPFANDEVDVGFMCAPCYVLLSSKRPSSVQLVGAAPLYDDPRAEGRPVYFSEVIVRADAPYQRFSELLGASWAYNDRRSLSGYISVLKRLASDVGTLADLGSAIHAGSHLAALEMVTRGDAAFAAIDSATLTYLRRQEPQRLSRLRVVEHLGPHPVQPVVARAHLPQRVVAELTAALLGAHYDGELGATMRFCGVERFVGVSDESYSAAAVYGAARPPWLEAELSSTA